MRGFQVAGGSVTGRAHAVLGRGNQDAFAWVDDDGVLVAVVCDGCSSGRHSEVGAHLGARLVATAVGRGVAAGADGLFLEVHPEPEKALSDAACMLPLSAIAPLLEKARRIRAVVLSQ